MEESSPTTKNFLQTMNINTLHIIAEVLALVGISYYFFNKNKVLMGHIQEITQRLEEQDEVLARHEEILKKLVTIRKSVVAPISSANAKSLPHPIAPQKAQAQKPLRSQDTVDSLLSAPVEEERPSSPVEPSITEITDLDDEIEQELSELK